LAFALVACDNDPGQNDIGNGLCLTAQCCDGRSPEFGEFMTCERRVFADYIIDHNLHDNRLDHVLHHQPPVGWAADICDNIPFHVPILDQNDDAVHLPPCTSQLFGFSQPAEITYGYWASVLGIQWHEGRNWYYLGNSQALTYALYLPLLTDVVLSVPEFHFNLAAIGGTPKHYGIAMIDKCMSLKRGGNVDFLSVTCLEVYNLLCTPNDLNLWFMPMPTATFTPQTRSIIEVLSGVGLPNDDIQSVTLYGPIHHRAFEEECPAFREWMQTLTDDGLGSVLPWIDITSREILLEQNKCLPEALRQQDKLLLERMLDFVPANPHRTPEVQKPFWQIWRQVPLKHDQPTLVPSM
jgi:hypothetical protein